MAAKWALSIPSPTSPSMISPHTPHVPDTVLRGCAGCVMSVVSLLGPNTARHMFVARDTPRPKKVHGAARCFKDRDRCCGGLRPPHTL